MDLNDYATMMGAPPAEEIPPRYIGMARLVAQIEPYFEGDAGNIYELISGIAATSSLLETLAQEGAKAAVTGTPPPDAGEQLNWLATGAVSTALLCQFIMDLMAREIAAVMGED